MISPNWNPTFAALDPTQKYGAANVGFQFGDITFYRYRGKIGTTAFIPDADCRFVPEGVPDLMLGKFAPANYVEAVGTTALRMYSKQVPKKFDTGIEMQSQTNAIYYCTRPGLLVRGTTSN